MIIGDKRNLIDKIKKGTVEVPLKLFIWNKLS